MMNQATNFLLAFLGQIGIDSISKIFASGGGMKYLRKLLKLTGRPREAALAVQAALAAARTKINTSSTTEIYGIPKSALENVLGELADVFEHALAAGDLPADEKEAIAQGYRLVWGSDLTANERHALDALIETFHNRQEGIRVLRAIHDMWLSISASTPLRRRQEVFQNFLRGILVPEEFEKFCRDNRLDPGKEPETPIPVPDIPIGEIVEFLKNFFETGDFHIPGIDMEALETESQAFRDSGIQAWQNRKRLKIPVISWLVDKFHSRRNRQEGGN